MFRSLDLCKKDENGSSAFFWPLGARSINYRWETPGLAEGQAPETQVYKYLYLQANPVVWWASFAGVLLGFAMLLSHVFFAPKKPLEQKFFLTVFLAVYASYMIAISRIDRVMYLYHYFLPLLLSFLILAIVIQEIQAIGKYQITASARTTGVMIFGLLVFFSFQFYRRKNIFGNKVTDNTIFDFLNQLRQVARSNA
jgi:dolichyl-phosphate-mannose--protein O-mannosyl transferase